MSVIPTADVLFFYAVFLLKTLTFQIAAVLQNILIIENVSVINPNGFIFLNTISNLDDLLHTFLELTSLLSLKLEHMQEATSPITLCRNEVVLLDLTASCCEGFKLQALPVEIFNLLVACHLGAGEKC